MTSSRTASRALSGAGGRQRVVDGHQTAEVEDIGAVFRQGGGRAGPFDRIERRLRTGAVKGAIRGSV